jgi:hypothetical protein
MLRRSSRAGRAPRSRCSSVELSCELHRSLHQEWSRDKLDWWPCTFAHTTRSRQPPRRRPRVLRMRQGVCIPPGARRPQGQPLEATTSRSGSTSDGGGAEAAAIDARVPCVREDVPHGAGAGRAQPLPLQRHHRQRRLREEQARYLASHI